MRLDPNNFSPDLRDEVDTVNAEFAAMGEALEMITESDDISLIRSLTESNEKRKATIKKLLANIEAGGASSPQLPQRTPRVQIETTDSLISQANASELEQIFGAMERLEFERCEKSKGLGGFVWYVTNCIEEIASTCHHDTAPNAESSAVAYRSMCAVTDSMMKNMVHFRMELERFRRRRAASKDGK